MPAHLNYLPMCGQECPRRRTRSTVVADFALNVSIDMRARQNKGKTCGSGSTRTMGRQVGLRTLRQPVFPPEPSFWLKPVAVKP